VDKKVEKDLDLNLKNIQLPLLSEVVGKPPTWIMVNKYTTQPSWFVV